MNRTIVDRNIHEAFVLARSIVDDPAVLDEIPPGATVILLPDDDPESTAYNLDLARQIAESGADVYLRHTRRSSAIR